MKEPLKLLSLCFAVEGLQALAGLFGETLAKASERLDEALMVATKMVTTLVIKRPEP